MEIASIDPNCAPEVADRQYHRGTYRAENGTCAPVSRYGGGKEPDGSVTTSATDMMRKSSVSQVSIFGMLACP
jgi:hypothetical protein